MTMEGVILVSEQKSEKQKDGEPWKILSKCRTYEEAVIKKKNFLAENSDVPVKIKFSSSLQLFLVKTRKIEKITKKNKK